MLPLSAADAPIDDPGARKRQSWVSAVAEAVKLSKNPREDKYVEDAK
jgi:hypothetical protein